MIRFAVDENFNNAILRGLLRRNPDLDIIRAGKPMPGIFEVGRGVSIGIVIEVILLIAASSIEKEWEEQVRYLPL